MISHIFDETIGHIEDYLGDPQFDAMYRGELRVQINQLTAQMAALTPLIATVEDQAAGFLQEMEAVPTALGI